MNVKYNRRYHRVCYILCSNMLYIWKNVHIISVTFLFCCDQAAPKTLMYVCPSVCLSAGHTFFTMILSVYHHEIFSIYCHWQNWCQCKWSRLEMAMKWCTDLKVALKRYHIASQGHPSSHMGRKMDVFDQIEGFQTVTPVWVHRWLQNDTKTF